MSMVVQPSLVTHLPASVPLTPTAASPAQQFAQNGFVSIQSLTTSEDIARIRSLLDSLFERFDSLGERAVDIAGPRIPGAAMRSPEINEALRLAPELKNTRTYMRCKQIARQFLGA